MILPSTSSQLQPQFRQHHQPIRQRQRNPRLRKPLLPHQQPQPRLMPVILTTTRRPIGRVTNTSLVNRRRIIPTRTPKRPPKHKPHRSITRVNRMARPDSNNTHIRPGINITPRRNPMRLQADLAKGRHSHVLLLLLLPPLGRRRRVRCRHHMRAFLVRPLRHQASVPWRTPLQQRRRVGNRTNRPRAERGRDPLARRGMSLQRYLHT